MQEEISDLISLMKDGPKYSHEHKYVKKNEIRIPYGFTPFTTNSFFQILFGDRYARSEHEELLRFSDAAFDFSRETNEYGRLVSMLPWIRFIFPGLSGFRNLFKSNMKQFNYFKKRIEERIANFKEHDEDMPFLDLYIKEWKKGNHDPESFEREFLVCYCLYLMFVIINSRRSIHSQLLGLFDAGECCGSHTNDDVPANSAATSKCC